MKNQEQQSTHTPGPWYVRRNNKNKATSVATSPMYGRGICSILKDRRNTPEQCEANAQLISAAPQTAAKLAEVKRELAHAQQDLRHQTREKDGLVLNYKVIVKNVEKERDELKAINAELVTAATELKWLFGSGEVTGERAELAFIKMAAAITKAQQEA